MHRPRSGGRASLPARESGGGRVRRLLIVPIVALACVLAAPAAAVEVTFPLTIDYEVLRTAVRKHLGEESGGALELWRTADGCGTFVVRDPVLEPVDKRIRITGPASATAGLPLLGWCFGSVTWNGHAEILTRPELGHDWRIRFRDVDFNLYNAARQPATVATRLWTVVRDWSAAELETLQLRPRTARRGGPDPAPLVQHAHRRPGRGAPDAPAAGAGRRAGCRPAPRQHRPASGTARAGRARASPDPRGDPAVGSPRRQLGRLPRLPGQGCRRQRESRDADRAAGPPAHGPARGDGRARPWARAWCRPRPPPVPPVLGPAPWHHEARRNQGQRRRQRPPVRGVPGRGRRPDRDRGGGAVRGPRLLGRRPTPAGPHAGAGVLGRPARVLRRAGPEAPGPVPVQGPGRASAADAAEARGGAALVAPVLGHAPLGARRRGRRAGGSSRSGWTGGSPRPASSSRTGRSSSGSSRSPPSAPSMPRRSATGSRTSSATW